MEQGKDVSAAEAEEMTLLDLGAVGDETLDDVEAMPDFVDPPDGTYQVVVKASKLEKKKESGLRVRITYQIVSTVAMRDETEDKVPDGSLFSETFNWDEKGKPYFKRQAAAIMTKEALVGVSVKDLLENMPDESRVLTVAIKNKESTDKEDPTKKYNNISVRVKGTDDEQPA